MAAARGFLHRTRWVAFHDVIMQAPGNRIARGVVRALESQVVNTARYMGRPERAMCVASAAVHQVIRCAWTVGKRHRWAARRYGMALGLVSVARPRAPSSYER
jgi:DNA-binding FadR family transcriptional regulator